MSVFAALGVATLAVVLIRYRPRAASDAMMLCVVSGVIHATFLIACLLFWLPGL